MWMVLNDAFLSIVDKRAAESRNENLKPGPKDMMIVRARIAGDIEQVFGKHTKVQVTPERDYRFRAFVTRQRVMDAVAAEVMRVTYGNFKDSVFESDRHDAYAGIWSIMNRIQYARQKPAPKSRQLQLDQFY